MATAQVGEVQLVAENARTLSDADRTSSDLRSLRELLDGKVCGAREERRPEQVRLPALPLAPFWVCL